MSDLTRLKLFCTNNDLTPEQISELFDLIKELQASTIDDCYKKILEVRLNLK